MRRSTPGLLAVIVLAAALAAGVIGADAHPGHPQKKLFGARWYQSQMDLSTSQLGAAARANLEALRQAVPGLPHIELKKLETFDALESLGVIVALRVTEGDEQATLTGVCPNAGPDLVRAVAVAVLNATNRRLGTG